MNIPTVRIHDLLDRYDGLLIDAYGVLVHRDGSFPGASDFMEHLKRIHKPYCILTNDASRNAQSAHQAYKSRGISVPAERIITSGSLIGSYIEENELQGASCIVMGTEDSKAFVTQAGGVVVDATETEEVQAVIVCDDAGFPFLETVEATMSLLFRRLDAGLHTHLVVANPDLIYQKNERDYGLTGGSIALILEHALRLRYLHDEYRFVRLGKPHTPIFEKGVEKLGSRNLLMIGDQLRTDILGANTFGIDSALIATGLVQLENQSLPEKWTPTFILQDLNT